MKKLLDNACRFEYIKQALRLKGRPDSQKVLPATVTKTVDKPGQDSLIRVSSFAKKILDKRLGIG